MPQTVFSAREKNNEYPINCKIKQLVTLIMKYVKAEVKGLLKAELQPFRTSLKMNSWGCQGSAERAEVAVQGRERSSWGTRRSLRAPRGPGVEVPSWSSLHDSATNRYF